MKFFSFALALVAALGPMAFRHPRLRNAHAAWQVIPYLIAIFAEWLDRSPTSANIIFLLIPVAFMHALVLLDRKYDGQKWWSGAPRSEHPKSIVTHHKINQPASRKLEAE
ncbi:MAG: hypothetical protein HOO99_05440 [Hyphomicrobiaceae bacterium]|nr:hypothetical protein [Hyphomicrobiaceae bacterium]